MKITYYLTAITCILIIAACGKSSTTPAPTPTPTGSVPILSSTVAIHGIYATSAKSGGAISSEGSSAITAKGVCWSITPNPTIANTKTNDGSGIWPGAYESIITGLNPSTTYYVRAYASNNTGTGYGNEISFTTLAGAVLPLVATLEATSIAGSNAVCGAVITSDGGSVVTARGVCWSTAPNPTTLNFKTSDGTGTGTFASNLTGLTELTTYYVRAYATNTVGTAYGNEISFKTIEAGTVFIGVNNNKFYALNALTGQKKWEYTGPSSFTYVDPCFANGKVYTGGGLDGKFYCLDTLNGNLIWSYQVGIGVSSPPVYDNGTIYFGAVDDYLYALDANTGALKWRYLTGANVSSSPVVQNNVVYFGSDDTKVYALNASTGAFIWSYTTGQLINGNGAALVNGILYIGGRSGFLYAINSNNGSLAWSYDLNFISLEHSSATVVNNVVYIGGYRNLTFPNLKGSLYAFNAATGALIWERLVGLGFNSSPVIENGKLVITTEDGELIAVNAVTGAELWRRSIYSNGASPVIMNGIVYVGGGGTNNIYAIDITTGADKWKFPITGSITTSGPCVVTASSTKHSGDSGMQQ